MRPRLLCAALSLLATVSGGCQTTASGRAIEDRIGNSLQRLVHESSRLLTGEILRSRTLPRTLAQARLIRPGELRELLDDIQQDSASLVATFHDLPKLVRTAPGPILSRASEDLRALMHPEISGLRPGVLLQQWRTSLGQIAHVLQLDGAVLPGPGDLDRTEDPHQVGRQLTWIERLLSRF